MHGSTPIDDFAAFTSGTLNIPEKIPVFPLPKVVLLPGEILPLHIFEPRYRAMVSDALNTHRVIGMVEIDMGRLEETMAAPVMRELGCAGYIAEHKELPDGRFLLWLLGLERFRIDEELPVETPYRQVRVSYRPIEESAEALAGIHPVRNELRRLLPKLVDLDETDRIQLETQMTEVSDSQLIALACQILELTSRQKRRLLESDNQVDRFILVHEELYRHLESHPEPGDDQPETLN